MAISVHNVIRYVDDGLDERLRTQNVISLKQLLAGFIGSQTSLQILESISDLNQSLQDDFWSFVTTYGITNGLDKSIFGEFLQSQRPEIRPILRHKVLLNRFSEQLKEYFLSDASNVGLYVEQNLREQGQDWRGNPRIPNGISLIELSTLVTDYVNSSSPSHEYLVILSELPVLPPRVRLLAKRKAESEMEAALSSSIIYRTGVEIKFQDQEEPVCESFDNGILKRSFSTCWIRANLDRPTLLNNFIYLFGFIDMQGRIALCHLESESGLFEMIAGIQRTDRYPEGHVYMLKNQAALLSLDAYSRLLSELGTSIEELLTWFFRDYLSIEFNIDGLHADIPDSSHSLLDKCKLLVSEIERILKMYQMYVEDQEIDIQLLNLSTDQFSISACSSLCEKKYCYISSQAAKRAEFYLYSDQCMLHYDHNLCISHESFAQRLVDSPPTLENFDEYQRREIEWLINIGYLEVGDDKVLRIKNMHAVGFLGEMHRNGCLVYHSYSREQQLLLDKMLDDGSIRAS